MQFFGNYTTGLNTPVPVWGPKQLNAGDIFPAGKWKCRQSPVFTRPRDIAVLLATHGRPALREDSLCVHQLLALVLLHCFRDAIAGAFRDFRTTQIGSIDELPNDPGGMVLGRGAGFLQGAFELVQLRLRNFEANPDQVAFNYYVLHAASSLFARGGLPGIRTRTFFRTAGS